MEYTKKLLAIFDKIGHRGALEQLLEECGELCAVGAKQLRIFRGVNYTPVTLSENSNNLIEEAADVSLCLDLFCIAFSANADATKARFTEIKAQKLARWLARLEIQE